MAQCNIQFSHGTLSYSRFVLHALTRNSWLPSCVGGVEVRKLIDLYLLRLLRGDERLVSSLVSHLILEGNVGTVV